MGRSQETFNKKEVRNKKEKKRKEKEKRRLAKKEEGAKKSSLDDMIAYVDENGQITSEPPSEENKTEINVEDIEISTPKMEDSDRYDPVRKGIVNFFNESKGFGFIRDKETQNKIFVHVNNVNDELKEGAIVTFEIENGPRGQNAVNVSVVK